MNKFLIITSINPPTISIKKHVENLKDWDVVVVADKKTPIPWDFPGAYFLSIEEQLSCFKEFASMLPYNSYSRKNLGYLFAIFNKAEIISETDDDNEPLPFFLKDCNRFVKAKQVNKKGWENIYTHFTTKKIWPRGFPLEYINDSIANPSLLNQEAFYDCPVQQFLADGDPDVDAIYRLTTNDTTIFNYNSVVMSQGTYCPFNSQNTIWWPETFPLLYLPSFISTRMTDIWRSLIAQICIYATGKNILFGPATVFQNRNEHLLISDFKYEIDGYLKNIEIINILSSLTLSPNKEDTGKNMLYCYEELIKKDIIPKEELELVKLWLELM